MRVLFKMLWGGSDNGVRTLTGHGLATYRHERYELLLRVATSKMTAAASTSARTMYW